MKKNKLILTRPLYQNHKLIESIKMENLDIVNMPLIEIEGIIDYKHSNINQKMNRSIHCIIFISTNAVIYFGQLLKKFNLPFPKANFIAAIGKSTAQLIKDTFGAEALFPKNIYDSEHLMALSNFDNINEKYCLIIRGKGGRETLKNLLINRGAIVEYLECYQRSMIPFNAENFKDTKILGNNFILISSNEAAQHFVNQITKLKIDVSDYIFIVNHERIAEKITAISNKIKMIDEINAAEIQKTIQSF
jgi:uroporphyrinogen-III synthase